MLFKLNWINQFVDLKDKTPQEIYDGLNSLGIEVEWYRSICSGSNLTSAKVVKKEKHPQADKLNLCQVDIGNEIVQIVCGANNFNEGDNVIVAKPGSKLPIGLQIKATEIRGQKSNGMICSLKELGYPQEYLSKEEAEGIYVFKADIKPGNKDVLSLLGLDDTWFEIAITPNRADWHGIYEIAKELAVYFKKDLKAINKAKVEYVKTDVAIEKKSANGFGLLELNDLKIKLLPEDLILNLKFTGIQLILPYVDLGNIVSKEMGQPLHLYDKRKVKGQIRSTTGLEGKLLALDNNWYQYNKEDIVIIDDSGVIGLAGLIGGKSTMVDDKTNDILVEVANFNNVAIRNTSQRLNLFTDASIRFAKKISTATIKPTVERVAFMFNKYFEAKINKCIISGTSDVENQEIDFDISMIKRHLGFEIDKKEVNQIFSRLGFETKNKKISIPAYRLDLKDSIDLIEEIARIYGYNNLTSSFSPSIPTQVDNLKEFDFQNAIRKSLVGQGLVEVITYGLSTEDKAEEFSLKALKPAILSYPISKDKTTMRLSAINSLIEVTKNNIDRGIKNINIFEISQINNLEEGFDELTILQYGNVVEDSFYQDIKEASFFSLKTTLIKLMADLGIIFTRFHFKSMAENKFFNHHNAANINIGNDLIGRLGQVHPAIAQKYKLKDIYVIQLDLDKVIAQKVSTTKAKALTLFPSVVEDYTVDVPVDLPVNNLIMMARKSSKLIVGVNITSIYQGNKIDDSLKAVTLKIEYNNPQDTIKEKEINEFREAFIKLCQDAKYTIRG